MFYKNLWVLLVLTFVISCSPLFSHRSDAGTSHVAPSLQGCALKFETENLCISAEWIEGPAILEPSVLDVKIWKQDEAKTPTNPTLTLISEPFMPQHGHGTKKPGIVKQVLDEQGQAVVGSFRIENMVLTMGGTWEIRLQLKNNEGQIIDQTVFEISLE